MTIHEVIIASLHHLPNRWHVGQVGLCALVQLLLLHNIVQCLGTMIARSMNPAIDIALLI